MFGARRATVARDVGTDVAPTRPLRGGRGPREEYRRQKGAGSHFEFSRVLLEALNSSNLQGPQALGVQLQNTLGPIYNADGEYAMISPTFAGFNVGPGTGRNNNYGYVNGDYYNIDQTINNVLLNAYIAYKPIENLTLKATGAVRNRSTFNNIFNNPNSIIFTTPIFIFPFIHMW